MSESQIDWLVSGAGLSPGADHDRFSSATCIDPEFDEYGWPETGWTDVDPSERHPKVMYEPDYEAPRPEIETVVDLASHDGPRDTDPLIMRWLKETREAATLAARRMTFPPSAPVTKVYNTVPIADIDVAFSGPRALSALEELSGIIPKTLPDVTPIGYVRGRGAWEKS